MDDHRRRTNVLDRYWWLWTTLFWLIVAGALLYTRWNAVHWFSLGDTDDNLRMAQVRALLGGQGWYDLRQYRLAPPLGADIHWSRLVDLPIAGLILAFRPIFGGLVAEKIAVAVAPMLPLLVVILGSALTARRLVGPRAWLIAMLLVPAGMTALSMFVPTRIDHHGWQLATLAWMVAGLADARQGRGGATAGAACAVSLVIGLELLPYVAITAGAIGLRWVWARSEAQRLTAYGATLGGGAAIGFVLFASYANRAPVCDALSPVWLSIALAGGALMTVLARLAIDRRALRLLAATGAGAAVLLLYVLEWPHCLGMLEGISPELKRMWFNNVREAKPIYLQTRDTAVSMVTLPLIGLVGFAFALWRSRRTAAFLPWASIAALALFSVLLLLWQTRAAASAQILAVPGATALAYPIAIAILASRHMLVRVLGIPAVVIAATGLWIDPLLDLKPAPKLSAARVAINRANRRCPTFPALAPIARLPKATILTFVDLGPRLIVATHHSAIAGPYHRNGQAILDVHHAFRGSEATAREVIARRGVSLVLICPGMSESTIYASEAPKGFYAQLARGRVPAWLAPVRLPRNSPFRLWRVLP
jgi:hypothetical protein